MIYNILTLVITVTCISGLVVKSVASNLNDTTGPGCEHWLIQHMMILFFDAILFL